MNVTTCTPEGTGAPGPAAVRSAAIRGLANESHFRQSDDTGYLDYFTGGISGITLTH